MNLSPEQKKKLKGILGSVGDSSDMKEMSILESAEISQSLDRNSRELRNIVSQISNSYQQAFSQMQESLLKGLEKLKNTIEESAKTGKVEQPDWSGFFKDMPTMLSQIGDNTGRTSQLIQNLKWNASQQLRNVNGSPINPAIAPFAITQTYDDVQLSDYDGSGNVGTVKYYQAGNLQAQLALTYDGSGNLTDVIRTH